MSDICPDCKRPTEAHKLYGRCPVVRIPQGCRTLGHHCAQMMLFGACGCGLDMSLKPAAG